jgi:dipeptidyl-peptidase-3
MSHYHEILILLGLGCAFAACGTLQRPSARTEETDRPFQYQTEQFADIRILRYQVPAFDELTLPQKELVYFLYEAGLSGRDIFWDQNYRHNLRVRATLENIVRTYDGDRTSDNWKKFMVYVKRVWFSNGIHHHYSTIKIEPGFPEEYFEELVKTSDQATLPLRSGQKVDDLLSDLKPILFDPSVDSKRVDLDDGVDNVLDSATNFYTPNLTEKEVQEFYTKLATGAGPNPISFGLNSQLAKEGGRIFERVWKVGGMYSPAIEQIVAWLEKAADVAEEPQRSVIEKLIDYYRTGNLSAFDDYSIRWVEETASDVDFINGFIEVYGDPLGYKGTYESLVYFTDKKATERIDALSRNAQWFEDHSPIRPEDKKKEVRGISARVITVAGESGDSSPSTPIGVNLPNANWIRKEHGSKSVNLGNIVHAYDESSKTSGVLEEFASSQEEVDRARKYGSLADNLHTDLHEVIGHASGQIQPGVGTPKETLRNYASTLEEARADLVALYFLMDPKLVELGVMPSLEVGKAGYDDYIRNGLLVQLARIKKGENLEEAHMRNRQMIAEWAYEKGKADHVIEKIVRDGKTYFAIRDYEKLRLLFGELLREIQRVKSEGDYSAGRQLVEEYGVKVDPALHEQVLDRYAKLKIAPYAGFINPLLRPVTDDAGEITDVVVDYPEDFTEQMLYYGQRYHFLSDTN